jgi:hypothetical protein
VSSRTIDVSAWVPAAEWSRTDPLRKRLWLTRIAARLRAAKVDQITRGIGADGRRLVRVQPGSRPDGTRDHPLIPHDEMSRTLRLLRVTHNVAKGSVTIHWGYWTTIVAYHADGAGYLPVRDVVGTPGRFLRPVRAWALADWRSMVPMILGPAGGTPARRPAAAVARPRSSGGFFL